LASSETPASEKPRYTQRRRGRWYWEPPLRLRKSHQLEVKALGADQVAAWAYARKLNKELAGLDPDAAPPGTVTWLFEQFFAGERFKSLAAGTQRDYRWIARTLGTVPVGNQTLGRLQARAIRPRHADSIYAALLKEKGHSAAHYACRVARRVWKWAGRRELVEQNANPWSDMELKSIPQRHQRWTAEQVRAVVAKSAEEKAGSIGLAVLLAYWFGHRQADVLGLTWAALDAEDRETAKTGARVPMVVSAYPELAEVVQIERLRQEAGSKSDHIVVCEATGRRWNRYNFTHEFRRIATLAGIPTDLQFRDLRATAATELADGGASVIEMSTHSGHKTVQMARRYARPTSEQFESAAAKRLAGRKVKE
jgi:integrase